jgi:hypothetical protein
MKALAILSACLAACVFAASPACAAHGHAGPTPHPRAQPHLGPQPHPGPVVMGGHGHAHHGYGGDAGIYAPYAPDFALPAYDNGQQTVSILPQPIVELSPGPYCPPAAPARMTHTGPRIIYIGHQPTVNGPEVIYGTD